MFLRFIADWKTQFSPLNYAISSNTMSYAASLSYFTFILLYLVDKFHYWIQILPFYDHNFFQYIFCHDVHNIPVLQGVLPYSVKKKRWKRITSVHREVFNKVMLVVYFFQYYSTRCITIYVWTYFLFLTIMITILRESLHIAAGK